MTGGMRGVRWVRWGKGGMWGMAGRCRRGRWCARAALLIRRDQIYQGCVGGVVQMHDKGMGVVRMHMHAHLAPCMARGRGARSLHGHPEEGLCAVLLVNTPVKHNQ